MTKKLNKRGLPSVGGVLLNGHSQSAVSRFSSKLGRKPMPERKLTTDIDQLIEDNERFNEFLSLNSVIKSPGSADTSESQLRSVIRETILKEILKEQTASSLTIKLLVSDIMNDPQKYLSSKQSNLETITWKRKEYKALGFLKKGNPVVLITKTDLKPQDISTSGSFQLPDKDSVLLTNAGDDQNFNLKNLRDGNVVPVYVRDSAKDVTLNITKVDYGEPSIADIAIEVGGVLGAIPLIGEPIDVATAVLSIYKDPPDYLLAAISVICAIPVMGVGAALARPILKRLRSGKEIGEKIGELALEQGSAELTTTAVKKAKDAAEEIIEVVRENAPENIEGFSKLKEVVSETFDGIDAWIARDVPLTQVRSHLRDKVIDAANLMRGLGLEFTENTFTKSGAETINFINAKFDGIEVVAKAADDGFKDAKIWRRLEEIEKVIPDRFKKFIPEIYQIKEVVKAGALQNDVSIVVIEKLFPLSSRLREILSPNAFDATLDVGREGIELVTPAVRTGKRTAGNAFVGDTFVPKINKESISDSLELASSAWKRKTSFPPPPGIEWSKYVPSVDWLTKYLRDESAFKQWRRNSFQEFGSEVTTSTASKDILIKYVKDSWSVWAKDQGLPELVRRSSSSPNKFFSDFWGDFVNTNLIRKGPDYYVLTPMDYTKGLDTSTLHPEVREFFEFLIYMAEKHNFKFSDMHVENVMSDAVGNLKLMDLGRFTMNE